MARSLLALLALSLFGCAMKDSTVDYEALKADGYRDRITVIRFPAQHATCFVLSDRQDSLSCIHDQPVHAEKP